MTPEEQALCDRLDACDKRFSGDAPHEAAALIRKLADENDKLARALITADAAMEKLSDGSTVGEFRKVYADALEIARGRT